jgi:hypothetical protein
MERLRELNTEPRGKWQGKLTSFISLLGMQLWRQISSSKAALSGAPRHKPEERDERGWSTADGPSKEGSYK